MEFASVGHHRGRGPKKAYGKVGVVHQSIDGFTVCQNNDALSPVAAISSRVAVAAASPTASIQAACAAYGACDATASAATRTTTAA